MRALALRNLKEAVRDPLALGLAVALPLVLLLVLQGLQNLDPIYEPAALLPGIVLFGFAMLTFSAAMTLGLDRDTDLFARLLTTPLRAADFVAGYSLPYLLVAVAQAALMFVVGIPLGLESAGNPAWVALVVFLMAVLFVALGMILGVVFPYKAVSSAWAVVLLLTIFGGAWFDLDVFPGAFRAVGNVLPFANAIDACRSVMVDGAGFGGIAGGLYWVLGYAAGAVALAVLLFRRRMSA